MIHGGDVLATAARDAHWRPGPNSGYSEAAGATGERSEKAFLGDDVRAFDWRAYGPMRAAIAMGAASWR